MKGYFRTTPMRQEMKPSRTRKSGRSFFFISWQSTADLMKQKPHQSPSLLLVGTVKVVSLAHPPVQLMYLPTVAKASVESELYTMITLPTHFSRKRRDCLRDTPLIELSNSKWISSRAGFKSNRNETGQSSWTWRLVRPQEPLLENTAFRMA